jgi:hypothetical protein
VTVRGFDFLYHQQIRHLDQNLNKETLELNDTIDQMDLTGDYRVFHPTTAKYTFFIAAYGTFFKIDHF